MQYTLWGKLIEGTIKPKYEDSIKLMNLIAAIENKKNKIKQTNLNMIEWFPLDNTRNVELLNKWVIQQQVRNKKTKTFT